MESCKSYIQISDEDYERYLKDAEEIEMLIIAAQRSLEQIERLNKPYLKKNRVKNLRQSFKDRIQVTVAIK